MGKRRHLGLPITMSTIFHVFSNKIGAETQSYIKVQTENVFVSIPILLITSGYGSSLRIFGYSLPRWRIMDNICKNI